jgi:hypothetical protein
MRVGIYIPLEYDERGTAVACRPSFCLRQLRRNEIVSILRGSFLTELTPTNRQGNGSVA